jgi:hypothetical protein
LGRPHAIDEHTVEYMSVRRLFIFLELSIDLGTQWLVFEANAPELWARAELSVTQLLRTQYSEGALFGRTEEDAFFVNVDEKTVSPDDIASGRLIIVVGVAPVRPAEFIIFSIAQLTSSAAAAQPQSRSRPMRDDPQRNVRFRPEIDQIAQAGSSEVTGFDVSTDPVDYRKGNEPTRVR